MKILKQKLREREKELSILTTNEENKNKLHIQLISNYQFIMIRKEVYVLGKYVGLGSASICYPNIFCDSLYINLKMFHKLRS